jgi:hypothetical protein
MTVIKFSENKSFTMYDLQFVGFKSGFQKWVTFNQPLNKIVNQERGTRNVEYGTWNVERGTRNTEHETQITDSTPPLTLYIPPGLF